MRIRDEQLRVLDDASQLPFENFMVAHLAEFTPMHMGTLGADGMRALVRQGVERARRYGFVSRGPVRFYIELIVLLGIDFDEDPQYPWVAETLLDDSIGGEIERADWLHDQVIGLLETAAGPKRAFAIQSLHRARQLPFRGVSPSSADFEGVVARMMGEMYPEKAHYVGEGALRNLARAAVVEAGRKETATDEGVCLFAGLMFAVGRGFYRDPKYPWIAGTLGNPRLTTPEARAERLYSKTMTYLDHVLDNLRAQ